MAKLSQATFVQHARTLIDIAHDDEATRKLLANYGYTDERLREGVALIDDAESALSDLNAQRGEKNGARKEFIEAWNKARKTYMATLSIARLALADDPLCREALELSGPRGRTFSAWYDQASAFYGNAIELDGAIERLGRYGYTAESLKAERAVVQKALEVNQAYAMETGESIESTADKNRKLAKARAWVSMFRTVLAIAYAESPEQLKRFGPLAPVARSR
ncbi:MAG TPA: hypothetical protein P5298_12855 [Spirochaetia bacterium]|nr:hypothetical protein [Spirochaetales bacterium]HRW25293.1 hypothetical protein [Spirochaetia bacterium]